MPDSLYIVHQDFTLSPDLNNLLGYSLLAFIVVSTILLVVFVIFIIKECYD